MPFQVLYNKLPNTGNKKNFVELDQDGKEVAVQEVAQVDDAVEISHNFDSLGYSKF